MLVRGWVSWVTSCLGIWFPGCCWGRRVLWWSCIWSGFRVGVVRLLTSLIWLVEVTKSCLVCLVFVFWGFGRMAVPISSSNPRVVLLREWMRDMDIVLGRDSVGLWSFERVLECWGRVLVPPRVLSGWYRDGGSELVRVCSGDPVWSYLARCLGHRLDRRVVLGCPRVAVMCAWAFFDGSWVDCEGVLGGDRVACYLYAGVRGGLPRALHSRMVMEGMVGKDEVLVRYLRDFG